MFDWFYGNTSACKADQLFLDDKDEKIYTCMDAPITFLKAQVQALIFFWYLPIPMPVPVFEEFVFFN